MFSIQCGVCVVSPAESDTSTLVYVTPPSRVNTSPVSLIRIVHKTERVWTRGQRHILFRQLTRLPCHENPLIPPTTFTLRPCHNCNFNWLNSSSGNITSILIKKYYFFIFVLCFFPVFVYFKCSRVMAGVQQKYHNRWVQ